MSEQADVLYINELAVKLGRSPIAVRGGIHKMMREGKEINWLPKPFMMGSKYAWLRSDVDEWLKQKAEAA